MAIFGKDGFVRQQEVAFAKKLLIWKYQKQGAAVPDEKALTAHAQQVVDEAHKIAKERGSNILEIVREAVREIRINKKDG